ncbi:MAG: hypothetical protein HC769_23755 [Cyanobacteria bacterium CRU_2_1]|nr:hypothetical protein [Cyanobacteria bacterium RU_5_0]NJR61584.1 hypothetical protein [Cyanobacteria bacterium CRU_2_1]
MLELNVLFEFSRSHCIAICAVLVPVNLVATLQTMLFTGFHRSIAQIYLMAVVSSGYALLLLLHVVTWLTIGVVMIPTYVLTFLGSLCLGINGCAVAIALYRNRTIVQVN